MALRQLLRTGSTGSACYRYGSCQSIYGKAVDGDFNQNIMLSSSTTRKGGYLFLEVG